MLVLTAIRKILKDDSAVAGILASDIYFMNVAQDAKRPNAMLLPVSGNDDLSHQGPDGLRQDVIRIYCRGDTFQQAESLARAIRGVLHAYVSPAPVYGVTIKLAHHVMTAGDYQDNAEVFRQIEDYRVHYRLD